MFPKLSNRLSAPKIHSFNDRSFLM